MFAWLKAEGHQFQGTKIIQDKITELMSTIR